MAKKKPLSKIDEEIRRRITSGDLGPKRKVGAGFDEAREQRDIEFEAIRKKAAFFAGIGTAANVPTSAVLGYVSSLYSAGFADSAFYKATKKVAYDKLDVAIRAQGYKVKERKNDHVWIVINVFTKEDI